MNKIILFLALFFILIAVASSPVHAQYSNGYNMVWLLGHNAMKFGGPINFSDQPLGGIGSICLGGTCISNWGQLNSSINVTPTTSLPASNITPGVFQSGLYNFTSSLGIGGTLFLPGYSLCTLKTNTNGQVTCGSDQTGITSISQGTGIIATPNPITSTGSISLDTGYTDSRYFQIANGITIPANNLTNLSYLDYKILVNASNITGFPGTVIPANNVTNGTFAGGNYTFPEWLNTNNLNVTGTNANATFEGDVQIYGRLYGGSPVKIVGGVNVTNGNSTFGEITVTSCIGCVIVNATANFTSINVTNGTFQNVIVTGNITLQNNSILDAYIVSVNWSKITDFPGISIPQANITTGIVIPFSNTTGIASFQCPITGEVLSNITITDGVISGFCINVTSNATSPQRDTTGFYLYNDTNFYYFNESQLNATINSHIDNHGFTIPWTNITGYPGVTVPWSNVTGFPGVSIPQENITTGITIPFSNVSEFPGITIPANNLTNISYLDYKILVSSANITGGIVVNWSNVTGFPGITIPIDTNTTGDLNWSRIIGFPGVSIPQGNITTGISIPFSNVTEFPGISIPQSNITTGITIPANNLTNISYLNSQFEINWSNVTGFPGVSIPQANITTGITIPITNTTGGNSVQCSGTDKVVNVTLSNGVISTMCAADINTEKGTTGFYLYNDTSFYYFNETQLNETIRFIINNTGITVNWSNVTGFPGISIPQENITGGITIPIDNTTGNLSWVRITGFPGVSIPQANITTGIVIPFTNTTGITSFQCSDSEVLNNVTIDGGVISGTCLNVTQKNTTGFYLYNDSGTYYFNETQLNDTINSIVNNHGVTIPANNLTNISYLNYQILISQENISTGITIPIDNTTGLLNWSRIFGFPGVTVPWSNVTGFPGVTVPWSNVTGFPGVTIPLTNTTGTTSSQCSSPNERATNVTIVNGVLTIVCDNVTTTNGITLPWANITSPPIGSFALAPASLSTTIGKSFTVDVTADSAGQTVSGIDVILTYNNSLLNVTNVTMLGPLTIIPMNTWNSTNIIFSQLTFTPSVLNVSVARITFVPLATGNAQVDFVYTFGLSTDSNMAANTSIDILGRVLNGVYMANPTYNESGISRNYTVQGSSLTGILPDWKIIYIKGTMAPTTNSSILMNFNGDANNSYLYRRIQGVLWLYQAVTVNPQKNVTLEQYASDKPRQIMITINRETNTSLIGQFEIAGYINSTWAPYKTTGSFHYNGSAYPSTFSMSPSFTPSSFIVVSSETT